MKVSLLLLKMNLWRAFTTSAVRFGLLVGLFSLAVAAVNAQQETSTPKRGYQSGASYSISEIENINTTNGNLMINIPLAKLPAGRGGLSQSLSLMYNSKLYDSSIEQLPDYSNVMTDQNMLIASVDGGWKYVSQGSYDLKVTSRFETSATIECTNPYTYGKNAFVWKVSITMPDGSSKEFRPTGYGDNYSDGYFNISANGYQTTTSVSTVGGSPTTYSCASATTLATTAPMVYYSTDGSYTKLVVDHSSGSDQAGRSNSWTMYMPDGGRVTGGGGATQIYDRNGNSLSSSGLGRSISVQTVSADVDHIIMQGAGNEELKWIVKWKEITVNKQYETTGAGSLRERGGTSTQTVQMDFRVVDRITLPVQLGSLYYEFQYNCEYAHSSAPGFGEISSIKLPSGANADYEFRWDGITSTNTILPKTNNVLLNYPKKKILTYLAEYDGSSQSVADVTEYSIGAQTSTITASDGSITVEEHGDTSYQSVDSGLVKKITNSNGSVTERIWAWNRPTGVNANASANINAYIKTEFTTIPGANGSPALTAIKDFTIDGNGNQTLIKEYDWVPYASIRNSSNNLYIPATAQLKRSTVMSYYNSIGANSSNAYWLSGSPNIRNAVKSSEIQNPSGSPVSRSEFLYDDPNTTGNLTDTKTWDSTKAATLPNPDANGFRLNSTNSISTSTVYDQYGNPTLLTDAEGYKTKIYYEAVNGFTGLYPTKTITAYDTPIQRTSTAEYDFYSGSVTSATDVDNNLTSATVYDALGRPQITKAAVGTPLEVWTQTDYDDVNRRVITKSDVETVGDAKKVATQFFDQLGRIRLSKTLENAATQSATNETDGIKVQTRYSTGNSTNNSNSYQITSNPYRADYSSNALYESSMGWTRSKSWNTGKHSEVETFSGAGLPAPWGNNTVSTGVVKTDLDADRTLVTDQAGKKRISRMNALGQLTDVWEIKPQDTQNPDNQLTTTSFSTDTSVTHGYQTVYQYDALNNLTTVLQGAQTRNFTYSSLSRLKSAQNPESGTLNYVYDNNGNLLTKTDARGVITTYGYDALNRVTGRTYSVPAGLTNYKPSEPVTYTYDALANAKGKLTKITTGAVSNPFSVTEYTEFDKLGRVTKSKQTTDSTAYPVMEYKYNLSGALVYQKYPSGREVRNVMNSDGDLSVVRSKKTGSSAYFDYAQNFKYTAAGAVSSMQLGNGKWESTTFNSRLQPTQIAVGNYQNGTEKLKLNFDYGSTNNNDNVLSQQITVPAIGGNAEFVATQIYTYDSLNRLESATETIPNQTGWKQTFKYDRYGNRTFDEGGTSGNYATTTLTRGCATSTYNPNGICDKKKTNPTTAANNQIVQDQDSDSLNDYLFDVAGNTTQDANSKTFTYDGENKQTKVMNGTLKIGEYFYDGDGKRVKKIEYDQYGVEKETTIFIYDADSKMVAEYSTNVVPSTLAKVGYLTADHLGSPRINTDKYGDATSRHDYHPFGEEIARTGYGSDEVRKKFTGYERDNESGLDYAGARYYYNKLGRFMIADYVENSFTSLKPVPIPYFNSFNPQSLNLYSFNYNNPMNMVDITGHDPKKPIPGGKGYQYRPDINNPNDSPNLHIFDRRGNEVGRVAIKGTADAPIYEWAERGSGVPNSIRTLIENLIVQKGWLPRPPLHPTNTAGSLEESLPEPLSRGGGRNGGRGGNTLNGFILGASALSLFTQLYLQQSDGERLGYYYNLQNNLVLVDVNKAAQNLSQKQFYSFGGYIFTIDNGKFVDVDNKNCTLEQNDNKELSRVCFT